MQNIQIPPIGLYNPFFIGDSVILEPLAQYLHDAFENDMYVVSKYPELFVGHPVVKGISPLERMPLGLKMIDMTDAIRSLKDRDVKLGIIKKSILRWLPSLKRFELFQDVAKGIVPEKVKNMYQAAGVPYDTTKKPTLYLTESEEQLATNLRQLFAKKCIGVVLNSRFDIKNWPYTKILIRELFKSDYDVFVIADKLKEDEAYLLDRFKYGAYHLTGLTLRQLMVWLSILDLVVGPDTGIMHMAGALDIPSIVLTRPIWADIYELYPKCSVICGKHDNANSVKSIPVIKVLKEIDNKLQSSNHKAKGKTDSIALFRLDGLGGTITLTDQAKKIYEMVGVKPTLITRKYKDLFQDNPYIGDIIEVGYMPWTECLESMIPQFTVLGEERFGIGKWHQEKVIFDQDFSEWESLFNQFPLEYRQLESHKLHHVQLIDKIMGLPYDTIDMDIYNFKPYSGLPSEYVVIANGVDSQHKGMKQTKCWDGWQSVVNAMDMPVVQIGTEYDDLILDTIDLRGQLELSQLTTVLRDAQAVVCCEGGIMHLAYAVKAKNVFILRGPTRGKLFEYPGHNLIDSYVCEICWSSTGDWYAKCPKGIGVVCMQTITPERVIYHLKEALVENMVTSPRI